MITLARKGSVAKALETFRSSTHSAQKQFGEGLFAEVLRLVEQTQPSLDSNAKAEILRVLSKHLNDELYAQRFTRFEEAIKAHFGRAGMQIDLAPFRPDIGRSLYDVGSKNFVSSTTAKISDELELIVLRQPAARNDQLPATNSKQTESKLEQANRFIKLEPNIFGFGFNLNYLIRRLMGKRD